ncbi:MAG: glutaminyl-peptide cyclotransferase, partial [Syntrophobacteraceae bacterium]
MPWGRFFLALLIIFVEIVYPVWGQGCFFLASKCPGPPPAFAEDAPPAPAKKAPIPIHRIKVLNSYPHDPEAFTQGLNFLDGFLYESTGLNGRSSVRKVELETGKIVQKYDLPTHHFGEGLTDWKGALVQLTWKSGKGF